MNHIYNRRRSYVFCMNLKKTNSWLILVSQVSFLSSASKTLVKSLPPVLTPKVTCPIPCNNSKSIVSLLAAKLLLITSTCNSDSHLRYLFFFDLLQENRSLKQSVHSEVPLRWWTLLNSARTRRLSARTVMAPLFVCRVPQISHTRHFCVSQKQRPNKVHKRKWWKHNGLISEFIYAAVILTVYTTYQPHRQCPPSLLPLLNTWCIGLSTVGTLFFATVPHRKLFTTSPGGSSSKYRFSMNYFNVTACSYICYQFTINISAPIRSRNFKSFPRQRILGSQFV